jgi:integral membrane protein (TIGR00529 family)
VADILRLTLSFLLIVVLLRMKMKIGYVMLMAAGFLSLSAWMSPYEVGRAVYVSLTDPVTVELIAALWLIRMFEMVLREHDILGEMMAAAGALTPSRRAAIVSMPLLIGTLPSVGGAYFSAPMVEAATRGEEMPPEEKGFVNYWYRHPWEYVLPLYPGILLAAALSGIALRDLILANLVFAGVMAASGFAVSMRNVRGKEGGRGREAGRKRLASFLPIGGVLLLVIAFRMELYMAILVVLAALFLFYRYGWKDLARTLRYGISWEVAVLIGGVMLFKGVMQASGAVENLSAYAAAQGVPLLPTLFFLPLATGLLTGLTIGFVGSTFPLLASLAGGGSLGAVALAFAAGFTGVLFSPVHVCLVLTREYFAADMAGIYRRMLLPAALVLAAAFALYFLL